MGRTVFGYCATCCTRVKADSFKSVTSCPSAAKPAYCDGGPDCCTYWVGGTDPLPIHVHGRLHPLSPLSEPLLLGPLTVTPPPTGTKRGFNICSLCASANRTVCKQLQLQQQQNVSQQQGAVLLNVALVAGIVNTSTVYGLAHKPRVPLGELPALGQEQQQALPGGFSAALSQRQPPRQSQRTRHGSAKSNTSGVDAPMTDVPVAGSTAFPPVTTPVHAPAASPAVPAAEVEPMQPPMASAGVHQPRFDATFTGTVPSGAEVLFLAMTLAFYPDSTFKASAQLIANLSQDAFYERMAPLFTELTNIPCASRSIRSYVDTARNSRASQLHGRKRAHVFAPQIACFRATDAGRHVADLLSSFKARDGHRTVQIKSMDVYKAQPHLMAVAGSDPYIRLYDLRTLGTGHWKRRGATPVLMQLAPPHLPLAAAARNGRAPFFPLPPPLLRRRRPNRTTPSCFSPSWTHRRRRCYCRNQRTRTCTQRLPPQQLSRRRRRRRQQRHRAGPFGT